MPRSAAMKQENEANPVIQNILNAIPKGVEFPQPQLLPRFIAEYFRHLPEVDLAALDPVQACHRALVAWEFLQIRSDEPAKIKLYNPTIKQYGWQAPGTHVLTLHDDMPFLVDSLTAEANNQGFEVFSIIHPILYVERDKKGELKAIGNAQEAVKKAAFQAESLIDMELSHVGDERDMKAYAKNTGEVFTAVRHCVKDWPSMTAKVEQLIGHFRQLPQAVARDEMPEALDFLTWLRNHHFVFLGSVDYNLDSKGTFGVEEASRLGLYAPDVPERLAPRAALAEHEVAKLKKRREVIYITKSDVKSAVHRPVALDVVSIKRFNNRGELIGESRFAGLFTSTVYFEKMDEVPLIRQKAARVLERAGFAPRSHDAKALTTILEFLPRDEMFQMSEELLFSTAMGVLSLETRPRVRVFTRKDDFERFIVCLVYVPRSRFSTEMRTKIQAILEETYNAQMDAFYTQLTDSPLARILFKLHTTPGQIPDVDMDHLNARLADAVSAWDESLAKALQATYGPNHGSKMMRIYGKAFSSDYVARYAVPRALEDIRNIEQVVARQSVTVDLCSVDEGEQALGLRLYSPGHQVALSDILPVLEHMGLKVLEEVPVKLNPLGIEGGVWVHDFRLKLRQGELPPLASIKALFEETLLKTWHQEVDNDGFNRLVIASRMGWRDVVMLRSYAKYLKQIRFFYSQEAIEDALAKNPKVASLLVQLFHARFNPELGTHRDARQAALKEELDQAFNAVTNVTEDRILRRYADLMFATMRTNFFQTTNNANGKPEPKSYLSFKFASAKVPFLPKPVPFAEIFVYSRRVEGIHLRGGKVSRGGLRWSDRSEDFRTEVLGLLKAQMVKNAVIVPEGAKGGFYVKEPPASGDRQEIQDEAIFCYITFLSGLLDVTDNMVKGKLVPPQNVVRYDGDDPYLVVAADKGTATFSDIANGVSESYGFWLGDAFASGGSAGYDHKKMGITAKGAWVSVQRHFKEMGIDPDRDPITVVGIGDMSGDVFGNGLLRSESVQLVGAFNHLHIFIDPNPDAKTSFVERQRMFALPRSTWADYNEALISKGGGVFPRSAKLITITPEMKARFGITQDSLTPDEMIRVLLMAQVDLIWNGGIGTYVKCEDESHADVGDRANEAVRVDGRELRCKVVGEGGNLGLTQRGRIEYALNGGRINTDAIDNSGGVDCSDHEVNIKIALRRAVESGALDIPQRDELLALMTPEVEFLVLRDNILQTQALTIAERQGVSLLGPQARVMRMLEKDGMLDRAIEFLPDDEQLEERRQMKKGLMRPELAVLLAYSKMHLFRDLLQSTLPDDAYFAQDLIRYFPMNMREKYAKVIEQHQLRREIIATMTTNSIINRVGSTFFYQLTDDVGMESCDIARAYVVARDSFKLRDIWAEIEALDGKVKVDVQVSMFVAINQLLYRLTLWLLRNLPHPLNVAEAVKRFSAPVAELLASLPAMMSETVKADLAAAAAGYMEAGVPEKLAHTMAMLPWMAGAYDVIRVSEGTKAALSHVAGVYMQLSEVAGLDKLHAAVNKLEPTDDWSRQAITAMESELYDQHARLAGEVLKAAPRAKTPDAAVAEWMERNQASVSRMKHAMDDIAASGTLDTARLVVALRKVEAVSRAV
jgi:glutamate dehydrogenase